MRGEGIDTIARKKVVKEYIKKYPHRNRKEEDKFGCKNC